MGYFSGHTRTARYKFRLKKHNFDFYAPLFMLNVEDEEDIPESVQVVIWRSDSPACSCGYLSEPLPLRIESDVLEYEFTKAMVNSKRYDFNYEDQVYSLYIPNEVFGDDPHPRRVYLQMALCEEG